MNYQNESGGPSAPSCDGSMKGDSPLRQFATAASSCGVTALSSDGAGPLAAGWEMIDGMLRAKNRNEMEIGLIRLAYYLGASSTIEAIRGNRLALVLIASEIREFEASRMLEPGCWTREHASR